MKIIHTADLHLDSAMTSLPKEKAVIRKNELIETFKKMVDYASDNDVAAILISGDLFDTRIVTRTLQKIVSKVITEHPDVTFFYLKGNHDADSFISGLEVIPENLKLFGNEWVSYKLSESVIITGVEISDENADSIYDSLVLDNTGLNIVMLHGEDREYKSKGHVISLGNLKNKGIDYLALGHIHAVKTERLDSRGMYCYPGCLEGRGFDECGDHGFMLLDINEDSNTINQSFISFAGRKIYELNVDITGVDSSIEIEERIDQILGECSYPDTSLVKIVLKGEINEETEINIEYLNEHYRDSFFYTRVKDETSIRIDYDSYEKDISLKGEFIRCVKADMSLDDETKSRIIRTGIDLLRGQGKV